MNYIILGGSGIQGEAIIRFLYKNTNDKIISIDSNPSSEIMSGLFTNERCEYRNETIGKPCSFYFERDNNNTVINCLPTERILDVMDACIKYRLNCIDLGGITEIVIEQMREDEIARKTGISIVPACGIAPGGISSIARVWVDIYGDRLQDLRMHCGGFPKYPKPPLNYSKVFYPDGVIKEYSGLAQEIKNGKLVQYPTMSGLETRFVPGLGMLESFRTSGGLSVSPYLLDIPNYSYRTWRYPGHCDYVKKHILSQKNPTAVLSGMLEETSQSNPDVFVLSVYGRLIDGTEVEKHNYWEYDVTTELSAMAQVTGYTVAAVATMIPEIPNGVIDMSQLDGRKIIEKVKTMGAEQYSVAPIKY